MSSNRNDHSWVTQEMFDKKLEELLDKETGGSLLMIPGLYEVVSEHFNNAVLEALEEERDPKMGLERGGPDDEDDDWEDPEDP